MSKQHDPVHFPAHYIGSKFEAWDVLDEFFGSDPLLWNAGKYLIRAGKKDSLVQDLQKAIVYIERRIAKGEG